MTREQTSMVRPLARIVPSSRTIEGGGFEVYRPFPTAELDLLDPFLLLDEMAPNYTPPGSAIGAPDHPHRGFETVTFVLEGEVEHRDSAGNHGIIGPGDVQWMTAGDGIVHSEMPSNRIQDEGGHGHGLQLWVNLPQRVKRVTPRYQALPAGELAVASGDRWRAVVVAGELLGKRGPAQTHTAVGVARLTVDPGGEVTMAVPAGHTAAVYAVAGSGLVGAEARLLEPQHLAVFERTAGDVSVAVPPSANGAFDAFALTGEPLDEPVARYGPFVMNTQTEIHEAIEDFNNGRMGSIPAVGTT